MVCAIHLDSGAKFSSKLKRKLFVNWNIQLTHASSEFYACCALPNVQFFTEIVLL
jgi:hypothetical protein